MKNVRRGTVSVTARLYGIFTYLLAFLLIGCGGGSSGATTADQTQNVAQANTPLVQPTTPIPSQTPITPAPNLNLGPSVLVANRASGTVSVIDAATDSVTNTITLPASTSPSTASYVSYSAKQDLILVGDDTNNRILVYNAANLALFREFPVPQDVFHIWNNGDQLWAVDRQERSLVVFDLNQLRQVGNLPIPADLRANNGVPHDVIVDADAAYVTISGVTGGPDMVVKYSTQTLTEVDRAPVGRDPHVILHPIDRRLFVACQDTDNVFVFNRDTMVQSNVIPLLGGHGVWIPSHGESLYVTNFPSHVAPGLPGPGADGLFTVNLGTETESGSLVTDRTPHNLISTPDGNKLYLTHSNADAIVTVFDISDPDRLPRNPRQITVGEVPFGIAFMP